MYMYDIAIALFFTVSFSSGGATDQSRDKPILVDYLVQISITRLLNTVCYNYIIVSTVGDGVLVQVNT